MEYELLQVSHKMLILAEIILICGSIYPFSHCCA